MRTRKERRLKARKKRIIKGVIWLIVILIVCFSAFLIFTDKTVVVEIYDNTDGQSVRFALNEKKKAVNSTDNTSRKKDKKETEQKPESGKNEKENKNAKHTVVIDAGHQAKQDSTKEPIGPGASEKKPKVSSGTKGVKTGTPEYEVTLSVAKKLEKILKERGYNVIMVRTSNDVNISNSERAEVANKNNADAFIRLHCNGAESSSVSGALTMCQTKNNKYCKDTYAESRALSECILEGLCEKTGAKNKGVSENDTMSGINWASVPVTIVEMGFMSNPEEDKKLCDDKYQDNLVLGMADGVDRYFAQ